MKPSPKLHPLALAVTVVLDRMVRMALSLRVSMDEACRETSAAIREQTGEFADVRPKPKRKRVRVRTKPLTPDDIVEGGIYVPKRGNDKTPNWVVESFSPGKTIIAARRTTDAPGNVVPFTKSEFLEVVARRVEVAP